MNKFNVGDRVTCMVETGVALVGRDYTVECVSSRGHLQLRGRAGHSSGSFVLSKSPLEGKIHPHYDLIMAWATGSPIEINAGGSNWRHVKTPMWTVGTKYRIRPTKKDKLAIKLEKMQAAMDAIKKEMGDL